MIGSICDCLVFEYTLWASKPTTTSERSNTYIICDQQPLDAHRRIQSAAATGSSDMFNVNSLHICPDRTTQTSNPSPDARGSYPLNLSILISGGEEISEDTLSNGE